MRQRRGGGEDRKRHPHRPKGPPREEGRRPDHERRLHRVCQRVQEACVERPEIAEGVVGERRARRDRQEESKGQPPHVTNPATRSTTQKAASAPTP
jgi:hypothetical protein